MVVNSKKKRKTVVQKDETPDQRTKRLMEFRVARADKSIRALAALAGSNYTLKENQKQWSLSVMKEGIKFVSDAFSGSVTQASGFIMPE